MSMASPIRVLPIEGTFNFRDLGGYPTTDGSATRWRTLYRSDSLHRLAQPSTQAVVDLGIRTIVDLRYPEECAQYPCAISANASVAYRSIPLFENPQRPPDGSVPHLNDIYRVIVDTRQSQLVAVIDALTTADALPAVINCTAGKDRTGIVVALVLSLIGVQRDAIVADFAASSDLLRRSPLGDEVRARIAARGGDPAHAERLLISPPEHMVQILAYIDEAYGGPAVMLIRSGLAAERIEALRALLLE